MPRKQPECPSTVPAPTCGAAGNVDAPHTARARHARYVERNVTYHVISRTRGNLFLMRPDARGRLKQITAGILSQARRNFPGIRNFATVVLSNHLHILLRCVDGDPRAIADYVGFIKRELALRWKNEVHWNGSIWGGYQCTALLTPEAEERAFDYVLAQGVKENLVEDPREWPGFHCAQALTQGTAVKGFWFNGTTYGKAFHAERVKAHPRPVRRADHEEPREFNFDKLPALATLDSRSYRQDVIRRIERIRNDARRERGGGRVLGTQAIIRARTRDACTVPLPPWYEERRRLIVWDDRRQDSVRAYLDRYWDHQRKYREASREWREADAPDVRAFPQTAFVPGLRPDADKRATRQAA
jgi:REP element-mobilizing transposase RayT